MTTTKIYKLPKVFASDHWGRDCGETDKIVRETKTHYYVEMDHDGYSDMESDADYYVECGGDMGRDYLGLVASARATYKALKLAGPPTSEG